MSMSLQRIFQTALRSSGIGSAIVVFCFLVGDTNLVYKVPSDLYIPYDCEQYIDLSETIAYHRSIGTSIHRLYIDSSRAAYSTLERESANKMRSTMHTQINMIYSLHPFTPASMSNFYSSMVKACLMNRDRDFKQDLAPNLQYWGEV